MTMAPNETIEGNARKVELQRLQSTRELTMAELLELRDLCRIAISHMTYSRLGSN